MSRLVNSNLPCDYKSGFEKTAQQRLLNISAGRPGTFGDHKSIANKGRPITPFSCEVRKNQTAYSRTEKRHGSGCDRRTPTPTSGSQQVVTGGENEGGDCKLSMFDVFLQLSSRDKEFGYGRVCI